jgi:hypothetical protein
MEKLHGSFIGMTAGLAIAALLLSAPSEAAESKADKRRTVIEHWTPARRAAARPRDLVIDHRGLGYLRRADGSLQAYGHQVTAEATPTPKARPGSGGDDTTPPSISNMNPDGAEIGAAYTFSATVTDNVELRSVTFVITYPNGTNTQSFSAGNSGGDTWSINLSGFSDGDWSWHVEAQDTAKRGGNTAQSAEVPFTVNTGGGGSGGGGGGGSGGTGVITNSEWTGGGAIQTAAGRIYFEMPGNPKRRRWGGYVCSGTVVTDNATGRSTILTAAHCVYDDANKAFARNVLFIPNQAGTSGSRTDTNCDNDPLGCWVTDFGVVDVNWTTRTFPDNIPWDYAFYVVEDVEASHQGTGGGTLDATANAMSINFNAPSADDDASNGPNAPDYTHAMGYSYSDDPNFMYCAEDMQDMDAANWWLPSCDLSGGSSGGPWMQPFDESNGTGLVISVNSWGYTTSPGMAGPKLSGTSAECIFGAATGVNYEFVGEVADGDAGYAVTCP